MVEQHIFLMENKCLMMWMLKRYDLRNQYSLQAQQVEIVTELSSVQMDEIQAGRRKRTKSIKRPLLYRRVLVTYKKETEFTDRGM